MGVSEAYVRFLRSRARLVLLVAGVVAIIAAPFALQLSSATVDSFPASPGTRSESEEASLKGAFPFVFSDRETVYIKCVGSDAICSCQPGACDGFKKVVSGLRAGLHEYIGDGTVHEVQSYFDFASDPTLAMLAATYYNQTAKSMIVTLMLDVKKGEKATKSAVEQAQSTVNSLAEDASFDVYLTGRLAAQGAATKNVGKAIGMADGTGILFIIVLFGYRTRSWRLTLVPVVNTVLCLLLAEALCLPLAKSGSITVPSFVPNVCLFLCIALSVDYSFFHLSRFQEVRKEGEELESAVEIMVRTAGRVVLVSGVVLLFTWLALACFPVFGVDALGYCASVTIFCCISVNMVMNPALVLAFPQFFSRAAQDPCRCCRRRRAEGAEGMDSQSSKPVENNMYGKIASVVTRMPFMIIVPVVVYAIFTPAAISLFNAELSVGGVQGGTDVTKRTTQLILQDFPSSSSGAPLLVQLSARDGSEVKNDEYFQAGCAMAQSLHDDLGLPLSSIKGAMLNGKKCISWQEAEASLGIGIYEWAWHQSVNPQNTSSLLTALPPYDTFSNQAKSLVANARKSADAFNLRNPGFVATCYHPMGVEIDAEALTARRFPWVITVTVAVVFSAIGVRYRAALVPIKLLFTIALPILFVLGCGVLVFQDGWLNWTRIPSLQSQGGLVWINPVACSFMLIGFALDYDLFLFSRIYDERKRGRFLEDRAAIIHSVAATGPVITTAGIIMALAFSGMVVQHDNPFLCQMGFTMILGVLVDTFVVRTLLVPALLSMAGRFNWWPGKMPSAPVSATASQVNILLSSA
eukprot:TRINITY_DN29612_c0_g1_i1.p1 TRINITY_DN29612_c0_g1~~TRINITY_DN29612_c0_g1_i1.p1  ORF type:complete len:833 (-),score=136.68 TRINITY_DN29612_c0_g1_i1:361-2775(-)